MFFFKLELRRVPYFSKSIMAGKGFNKCSISSITEFK